MLIAGIVAFCLLVFVVALIWPRLSRPLERGGSRPLGAGGRAASHAPGPLGRLLSKPFGKGQRAIHRSGAEGRKAHDKLTS
jgi:hypothetical protein